MFIFPTEIASLFLSSKEGLPANELAINNYVLANMPSAMRLVFAATPIIAVQLIGSAYFQAIGKAVPALLLTLTRQGPFFVPLVFTLPNFMRANGVWVSFPISDILSTVVTGVYLRREILRNLTTDISA